MKDLLNLIKLSERRLILAMMLGMTWKEYLRYLGWKRLNPFRPPSNATFLFHLFLSPKDCDAIVGDLEERYDTVCQKFGPRKANFWYWTQALRSVGPIAWAATKKVLLKPVMGIVGWAVAKKLLSDTSWLAMLADLYTKLRS